MWVKDEKKWNDKARTRIIKNMKMLRSCEQKRKEVKNDPLISGLGVKMGVNSVNISKTPLYFHCRHKISKTWMKYEMNDVNMEKYPQAWLRRVKVNNVVC